MGRKIFKERRIKDMEAMRKTGMSVKTKFDQAPYVNVDQEPTTVNVSDIVDPSANAVDPENKNFVPATKDELKLSVNTMLADVSDLEIPRVYELIKKAISDSREEETMTTTKKDNVEEIFRLKIRKMISEYWSKEDGKMVWKGQGSAPKLSSTADVKKFSADDTQYQAGLKKLRASWTPEREGRHDDTDADAVLKSIASRVKPEDPIGSIKRAARYLKDNVPGDVATNLNSVIDAIAEFNPTAAKLMKSTLQQQPRLIPKQSQTADKARDEIAKALGLKHGTNVRNLEQIAMEKFKKVADVSGNDVQTFSMKDNANIAVMHAMQDFIDVVSGPASGLFSKDDIELFKSNPEMASELSTFRVFLDPYLDVFVEDPENSAARTAAKSAGMKALKGELKRAMKGKSEEFSDLM